MKTFEKGNNFAVASGGLFILSIVFGILSILRKKVDVENGILNS